MSSLDAKREAAVAYLRERRMLATQPDSEFRYKNSEGETRPRPKFLTRTDKPRAHVQPLRDVTKRRAGGAR